jgi:hypothetical protein
VISNSVTPRTLKVCPSLRVPDQRHSLQGRVTVLDRPTDFGVEVGDPREHGLSVGAHLGSPDKGPARVRRLLAAVVLVQETGRGIEIMCVQGYDQWVNHLVIRSSRVVGYLRPAGVAMVPAVAHGVQRLKDAAAADASRPDRAADRRLRTHRDRAGHRRRVRADNSLVRSAAD